MTKAMQPSRPCKGCGATIHRTAEKAPVRHYCGPDCRPRCEVEGCNKPQHSKGWCSAHATRAHRYGDPLAPKVRGRNDGPCEVDGCDQPMRKTRLCSNHYAMQYVNGEIRDWKFKWGDGGYVATHTWLRRNQGPATGFPCADCGKQAEEWSYDHNDPDAKTDPSNGCLYSRKPECYSPRCVPCHRALDRAHRQLK